MSAQDSCLSFTKYLLFVFNLFFFVLGSLIFCFGIWILIDKTSFVSFVGEGAGATGEGLPGAGGSTQPHWKQPPGVSLVAGRPRVPNSLSRPQAPGPTSRLTTAAPL